MESLSFCFKRNANLGEKSAVKLQCFLNNICIYFRFICGFILARSHFSANTAPRLSINPGVWSLTCELTRAKNHLNVSSVVKVSPSPPRRRATWWHITGKCSVRLKQLRKQDCALSPSKYWEEWGSIPNYVFLWEKLLVKGKAAFLLHSDNEKISLQSIQTFLWWLIYIDLYCCLVFVICMVRSRNERSKKVILNWSNLFDIATQFWSFLCLPQRIFWHFWYCCERWRWFY